MGLSISKLLSVVMTAERSPLNSIKLRRVLTVALSRPRVSKSNLVFSGVTFSAWSMIFMASAVLSPISSDSRRPVRILRLLMRASMGVSRLNEFSAESSVEMTSAS